MQAEHVTDNEPQAIREILSRIRSNIPDTFGKENKEEKDIQCAVEENVASVTDMLRNERHIAERVTDGSLQIIPAIYMFETGIIIWK